MDFSPILKLIRTSDEKTEFENLVEKLIENVYKKRLDPTSGSSSAFTRNIWQAISNQISAQGISNDSEKIEDFLNSLLISVRGIESLKMTIALEPNENLIVSLSVWAQKNLTKKIIFDLTSDPNIIGGAIVASDKGEFADFSLLKKINDLFLSEKSTKLQ